MARKRTRPSQATHYLLEWRVFRGLSQEELAAKVKPATTAGQISLLESGKRRLDEKWLGRLSKALDTERGHILDADPTSEKFTVLKAISEIREEDRPFAISILETVKNRTKS